MKILHTSDWHLGHLLFQQRRDDEHRSFLEWLLELIREEQVDLLIVAGDVFDNGLPSNYALAMYFSFLARCRENGCAQIVIVGGNHDSPSTLQAPGRLLKELQVTVVGAIDPEQPESGIILAAGSDGKPAALVCPVPFLRDRDVHFPKPGEAPEDRDRGIVEGTAALYKRASGLAMARRENLGNPFLPIIATGHLFAQGTMRSEGERDLYIGDLGAFPAGRFPEEISYVALGHLHRPQVVGNQGRVRYSGSPIPLSFDEGEHLKEVFVFHPENPQEGRSIAIPGFRTLVKIVGDLPTIETRLRSIPTANNTSWVEVIYDGPDLVPDLKERVDDLAADLPLRVLACRYATSETASVSLQPGADLGEITPEEVFRHRLEAGRLSESDRNIVEQAFNEILQRVRAGETR